MGTLCHYVFNRCAKVLIFSRFSKPRRRITCVFSSFRGTFVLCFVASVRHLVLRAACAVKCLHFYASISGAVFAAHRLDAWVFLALGCFSSGSTDAAGWRCRDTHGAQCIVAIFVDLCGSFWIHVQVLVVSTQNISGLLEARNDNTHGRGYSSFERAAFKQQRFVGTGEWPRMFQQAQRFFKNQLQPTASCLGYHVCCERMWRFPRLLLDRMTGLIEIDRSDAIGWTSDNCQRVLGQGKSIADGNIPSSPDIRRFPSNVDLQQFAPIMRLSGYVFRITSSAPEWIVLVLRLCGKCVLGHLLRRAYCSSQEIPIRLFSKWRLALDPCLASYCRSILHHSLKTRLTLKDSSRSLVSPWWIPSFPLREP